MQGVAAGAAAAPTGVGPSPYRVGVYLGNPNASDSNKEAAFEANYASFTGAMRSKPALIIAYVDYTQPVANWPSNASWQAWSNAQSPVAKDMEPTLGLPMFSTASGAGTPDAQFRAFAAGTYDSEIIGVIQAWHQQGFPYMIVRVGWEMNLPGTPYYVGSDAQSQADWVSAYRHVYTMLHRTATACEMSIKVAWNPGITNYAPAHATTALYPGDAYVDVVAADIYGDIYPYSDGGAQPAYHDWATGLEDSTLAQFIANPIDRMHYWNYPAATVWSLDSSGGNALSLAQLIAFAVGHKKLFAISESGAGNCNGGADVCDDQQFPQWLASELASAVSAGVSISYVGIWDSNGGGNYEFSYPFDGKPGEAAAWARYFGYAGK